MQSFAQLDAFLAEGEFEKFAGTVMPAPSNPFRSARRTGSFLPSHLPRVRSRKRLGLVSNPKALTAQRQLGKPCHGARVVKRMREGVNYRTPREAHLREYMATALAPTEQWNTPEQGKAVLSTNGTVL